MSEFWQRVVAEIIFKALLFFLERVAPEFADVSHAIQEHVVRRGTWSGVRRALHAAMIAINVQPSPFRDALVWSSTLMGAQMVFSQLLWKVGDAAHAPWSLVLRMPLTAFAIMSSYTAAALVYRGIRYVQGRGHGIGLISVLLITFCTSPIWLAVLWAIRQPSPWSYFLVSLYAICFGLVILCARRAQKSTPWMMMMTRDRLVDRLFSQLEA